MNNSQIPKRIVIALIGIIFLLVGLAGLSSFPMMLSPASQQGMSFTGMSQYQNFPNPIIGMGNQMGALTTNQQMMIPSQSMQGGGMIMGPGMMRGMMGGSMMGSMFGSSNQMMPMGSSMNQIPFAKISSSMPIQPMPGFFPLPTINVLGAIPGTAIPLYPILLVGIYMGLVIAGALMIIKAASITRTEKTPEQKNKLSERQ